MNGKQNISVTFLKSGNKIFDEQITALPDNDGRVCFSAPIPNECDSIEVNLPRPALKTASASKLERQLEELESEYSKLERQYAEILHSRYWRMTLPLQKITGPAKKGIRKIASFSKNFFGSLATKGPHAAMLVLKNYIFGRGVLIAPCDYRIDKKRREQEENTQFPREIKFSILVPLYNTPKKFLTEMIKSVQNQTYKNFELCLADGSDDDHSYVSDVCRKAAENDGRIKYQKLIGNMGISENTNVCIDMSDGDYIVLFDHDDLLHPSALYFVMKEICEQGADFVYTDENTFIRTPYEAYCPHFKPDFAIDNLRANNYICHLSAFSRTLLEKAGKFRRECDGSQDYDMILRLCEQAEKIVHIPKILYYWRAHKNSVASDISAKPYVVEAAKRAISDHLERTGLKGEVLETSVPSVYRVKYEIAGEPLVSVIIANKDHIDDLSKCLKSIFDKTTYKNYEIIIVENNSTDPETFEYYKKISQLDKISVVNFKGEFNYSAINNLGARNAKGDYLLLLNNDIEIITPEWIEEMLMFASRGDVGAVGAMLYYPDNTVQHAGIGLGILGLAGHYHKGFSRGSAGYMGGLAYAQNVSAVTAACMMIPKNVYVQTGGLDEDFRVAFNDVDLCMRIRECGYLIVFTPFAEAYHYESKSRGLDTTPAKRARFESEQRIFHSRWDEITAKGDPYYNPNFSLDSEDFKLK